MCALSAELPAVNVLRSHPVLQCSMLPKVNYLGAAAMLAQQKEVSRFLLAPGSQMLIPRLVLAPRSSCPRSGSCPNPTSSILGSTFSKPPLLEHLLTVLSCPG
jgi:hypothetical protein